MAGICGQPRRLRGNTISAVRGRRGHLHCADLGRHRRWRGQSRVAPRPRCRGRGIAGAPGFDPGRLRAEHGRGAAGREPHRRRRDGGRPGAGALLHQQLQPHRRQPPAVGARRLPLLLFRSQQRARPWGKSRHHRNRRTAHAEPAADCLDGVADDRTRHRLTAGRPPEAPGPGHTPARVQSPAPGAGYRGALRAPHGARPLGGWGIGPGGLLRLDRADHRRRHHRAWLEWLSRIPDCRWTRQPVRSTGWLFLVRHLPAPARHLCDHTCLALVIRRQRRAPGDGAERACLPLARRG